MSYSNVSTLMRMKTNIYPTSITPMAIPGLPKQQLDMGKIVITVPIEKDDEENHVKGMDVSMDVDGTSAIKSSPNPLRQITVLSVRTDIPVRTGGMHLFAEDEDDSQFTTNTDAKAQFELENMALDDIIQLKKHMVTRSSNITNLGGPKSSVESEFGDEQKPSPISVLRKLAQEGMVFLMEVKELPSVEDKGSRKHRWRAEWIFEEFKLTGIGEGGRKRLAQQAGALDLVEKIRKNCILIASVLPECKIPIGCLINPFVFCMLENLVQDGNYTEPVYGIQVKNLGFGRQKFTCVCSINDDKYIGESNDHVYAKRFAAKRAYDAIAHTPFQLDDVIRGEKCSDETNYKQIESERNTILYVEEKNPKSLGISEIAHNERKRKNFKITITRDVSDTPSVSNSLIMNGRKFESDDESEVISTSKKMRLIDDVNKVFVKAEVRLISVPDIEILDLRVYDQLYDTETEDD